MISEFKIRFIDHGMIPSTPMIHFIIPDDLIKLSNISVQFCSWIMMDPVSVYNPSVIQYNPEDDEEDDEAEIARQEAQEQRELEQDIENEMGDLSGPVLDDSSEDESVYEDRQQKPLLTVQQPLRKEVNTPYTSSQFSANEEKVLLYGEQGHLQVCWNNNISRIYFQTFGEKNREIFNFQKTREINQDR